MSDVMRGIFCLAFCTLRQNLQFLAFSAVVVIIIARCHHHHHHHWVRIRARPDPMACVSLAWNLPMPNVICGQSIPERRIAGKRSRRQSRDLSWNRS